jgi:hypothetical protein
VSPPPNMAGAPPHPRPAGWRRDLAAAALAGILPATVPVALLLAARLSVELAGQRAGGAETLFLAGWAAAVLLPLAFLESARRPLFGAIGLAIAVLLCTLPQNGSLRPAAVSALLALAVPLFASQALRLPSAPGPRAAAALTLATAILLHGHRLFLAGFSVETLVLLGVLPGLAAALAARLAAAGRPGAGFAAALGLLAAPQLASEPWWIWTALVTAIAPASFAAGSAARLARALLFLSGAAALLAGSFPWLRPAPIASLLQAAVSVGSPVAETPLRERVVVLSATSPRFVAELSGAPIRSVIVDSYLTHGVDLPCGQELVRITAVDAADPKPAKAPWSGALIVGRDSAEWAAGRADVAARLACPAPAPWISWIPAAGRFLGQTSRARVALDGTRATCRLAIERNPELPAETALAIFFLATER